MTDTLEFSSDSSQKSLKMRPPKRSLLGRFAAQYSDIATPFEVAMPDGAVECFGTGTPTFRVTIRNKRGLRAIASLDEGNIADAYLYGDIDLDGDMVKPFQLRATMKDSHWLTEVWRYLQPLFFGQVYTNRRAISKCPATLRASTPIRMRPIPVKRCPRPTCANSNTPSKSCA